MDLVVFMDHKDPSVHHMYPGISIYLSIYYGLWTCGVYEPHGPLFIIYIFNYFRYPEPIKKSNQKNSNNHTGLFFYESFNLSIFKLTIPKPTVYITKAKVKKAGWKGGGKIIINWTILQSDFIVYRDFRTETEFFFFKV